MEYKTFWMEPTNLACKWLRRYSTSEHKKPSHGIHSASSYINEIVEIERTNSGTINSEFEPELSHNDFRWPQYCNACGYKFVENDYWQQHQESLWKRLDNNEYRVLNRNYSISEYPVAEPGAMWDAKWMGNPGPDGINLMVRCPPVGSLNDWPVDWPSRDGKGWTRTGDPRLTNVTATPSILIDSGSLYHGWLRDGYLIDI